MNIINDRSLDNKHLIHIFMLDMKILIFSILCIHFLHSDEAKAATASSANIFSYCEQAQLGKIHLGNIHSAPSSFDKWLPAHLISAEKSFLFFSESNQLLQSQDRFKLEAKMFMIRTGLSPPSLGV